LLLICSCAEAVHAGAPCSGQAVYGRINSNSEGDETKKFTWIPRLAATAAVGTLALTGCGSTAEDEASPPAESGEETGDMAGHQHNPEGGPPREGIEEAADPTDPVDTTVVLTADHMSGMEGAEATIESSTDETVYMVDTIIDGMEMTNHKWVVDSEIQPAE